MSVKAEIISIGYAGYQTPDEFGRDKVLRDWHMNGGDFGTNVSMMEIGGWSFDELLTIYVYSVEHGHNAAVMFANAHREGPLP